MIAFNNEALLQSLVGKTIQSIEVDDYGDESDQVYICLTNHTTLTMLHEENCCEQLTIGNWAAAFDMDEPNDATVTSVTVRDVTEGDYDSQVKITIETTNGDFWLIWDYYEGCSPNEESSLINLFIENQNL